MQILSFIKSRRNQNLSMPRFHRRNMHEITRRMQRITQILNYRQHKSCKISQNLNFRPLRIISCLIRSQHHYGARRWWENQCSSRAIWVRSSWGGAWREFLHNPCFPSLQQCSISCDVIFVILIEALWFDGVLKRGWGEFWAAISDSGCHVRSDMNDWDFFSWRVAVHHND